MMVVAIIVWLSLFPKWTDTCCSLLYKKEPCNNLLADSSLNESSAWKDFKRTSLQGDHTRACTSF